MKGHELQVKVPSSPCQFAFASDITAMVNSNRTELSAPSAPSKLSKEDSALGVCDLTTQFRAANLIWRYTRDEMLTRGHAGGLVLTSFYKIGNYLWAREIVGLDENTRLIQKRCSE